MNANKNNKCQHLLNAYIIFFNLNCNENIESLDYDENYFLLVSKQSNTGFLLNHIQFYTDSIAYKIFVILFILVTQ